jgi:DNA polymerase III epsilon subunit-like protein
MGRLVFFDLETTGLDPRHHQPIQIGAVAVDGETLAELAAFEVKVRFQREQASPEALAVNSFEDGAWGEAVSEREAARRFAEFLKAHATLRRETAAHKPYLLSELCAFNSAFDLGMVQAWYERLGLFLPASWHARCVMQRAFWYWFEQGLPPPPDWKLGTLCRAFGVELGESAHDALADARATAALYRKLLAGSTPRRVAKEERPKGNFAMPPRVRFKRRRRRAYARTWR